MDLLRLIWTAGLFHIIVLHWELIRPFFNSILATGINISSCPTTQPDLLIDYYRFSSLNITIMIVCIRNLTMEENDVFSLVLTTSFDWVFLAVPSSFYFKLLAGSIGSILSDEFLSDNGEVRCHILIMVPFQFQTLQNDEGAAGKVYSCNFWRF